jgi:hypothetical protein
MKRLIALLIVLLLSACGTPQPSEPAAAEPVVAEPVVEAQPVQEEQAPATEDDTAERLAEEQEQKIIEVISQPQNLTARERKTIAGEMFDIFNTLDSYKFKSLKGTFFVRGDKARILLRNPVTMRGVMQGTTRYSEVLIDEVILDRAKKEAVGYCFGETEQTRNECGALEIFDTAFNISYSDFYIKMPDDWLKEYLNVPAVDEEYEKYFVNSVETVRVKFKDGVEMFFFPRAGLPIKVVKSKLDSYEYDNLVPNQARPEDVIHRSRESIPATESFYKQIY